MNRIVYSELPLGDTQTVVEALTPDAAVELAPAVLRLIVASYSRHFEGPGKPLPHGVWRARYGTAAQEKRFRKHVIPGVFKRRGGYWAIREPADDSQLVGVLKTLPGEAIKVNGRRFDGMVGIAEVITAPEYQGYGYGAALLHAHLRDPDIQEARVMLDAFDNSSINDWYGSLGFQEEESSGELELGNGYALPTHYWVTPEDIVVRTIVQRLEERRPALRSAIAA